MTPLSLKISNFRSIRDMEIQFPEGHGKVIFVSGENQDAVQEGGERSNGSGKSSLFESLLWCLYGSSSTINSAGDPKLPIRVELQFRDKGGIKRTLVRESKPSRTFVDGESVSEADYQVVVGIPKESYLQAIYHSQNRESLLLASPTECFQLFSVLCGHDRYMQLCEETSRIRQECSKRESVLMAEGDKLSGFIEGLKHSQKVSNNDTLRKQKLLDERKQVVDQISDREKSIEENRILKSDILEKLPVNYRELMKKYETDKDNWGAVRNRIKTMLRSLRRDPGVCPVCKQKILSSHVVLEDLWKEYRRLGQAWFREIKKYKEFMYLNNILTELAMLMTTFERDLGGYRQSLASYDRLISDLSKEHDLSGVLNKAEGEYKVVSEKIALASNSSVFWGELTSWLRNRAVFSMQSFLDHLSVSCSQMMRMFGMDYEFRFFIKNIEDSTKKLKIEQEIFISGRPLDVRALSGGEFQILGLVLFLVLSSLVRAQQSIHLPFLILDEPTPSVDSAGVELVMGLLKQVAENEKLNIFVVEHQRAMDMRCDIQWRIVKSDGISRFVV